MNGNSVSCGGIIATLIGFLLATVGTCLVIFWGLPTQRKAKASQEWPTVSGVVKQSKVVSNHDNEGGVTYSAEIVYEYDVDGQPWSCNTVWFGDDVSTNKRSTYVKLVNKYSVGSQVDVHYNPDDPSVACLEPGTKWTSYFGVGFGGIFAVIGCIILIVIVIVRSRKIVSAN